MSTESVSATQPGAVLCARVAVSLIFLLFGLNIGLWAAHIPLVQERLGIDPATLGLALLMAAVGTLLSQPLVGVLIARIGSRLPAIVLPPLAAAAVVATIMSPSVPFLFIVLSVTGPSGAPSPSP